MYVFGLAFGFGLVCFQFGVYVKALIGFKVRGGGGGGGGGGNDFTSLSSAIEGLRMLNAPLLIYNL